MNFLRGVMGGQSAGPQHTEAETVRGAVDLGLGKGPGRNRDGGIGVPEVTSRAPRWAGGFTRRLPLCLPSPESPEFFPSAPSAAPTAAARPCGKQAWKGGTTGKGSIWGKGA